MDPKELRGLVEAYNQVYELDENRMASRMEKMPSAPAKVGKATHSIKDISPSKPPTPEEKAKARKALGLGEATAMAKRGLDEPTIRQNIAKSTGGGQSVDRANALANKSTFGSGDSAARQKLARSQAGDFRKTNSSNPGLKGYAHKSNDPDVKAKQAARGAQRGSATLTPNEKKKLNMGEAVKGESSERRRDLAAQRRAGDKPLSPAKGRDNANKMQRDINYFDKLTKKNKNVVGLVSNEEVDLFDTVLEFLQVEGYENPEQLMSELSSNHIDAILEAQEARNNPEKYEREQSKKSAPVRGERTPMPPRGDKRREDFEKWYAANGPK